MLINVEYRIFFYFLYESLYLKTNNKLLVIKRSNLCISYTNTSQDLFFMTTSFIWRTEWSYKFIKEWCYKKFIKLFTTKWAYIIKFL